MESKDGKGDAIAQSSSSSIERPVSKKPRLDDDDISSSEDDDYYSNFDKMYMRQNMKNAKSKPKSAPVEIKEPCPRLVSSSDSESDIEEIKEENALATLMKKGKKFNEDREKKVAAEMNKIKELAQVREAEEGAQPDLIFVDNHTKQAEIKLRRLKEDRQAAQRRSIDTGYVDCVVIDGGGRQRTERDYTSYAQNNHIHNRGTLEVTFLLQDLNMNDTKIEKMNQDAPMRSFVERMSKRWNCKEMEVVLTLEGGTPVTDLDLSPRSLNISIEGIHTISAVYVPNKKNSAQDEPTRDPNMIAIKFQSGQGKPAMIEMKKDCPFSAILCRVAEGLKMASVGKLVFDNEKVDFSSTPIDLDMDDEDCMDVYAA